MEPRALIPAAPARPRRRWVRGLGISAVIGIVGVLSLEGLHRVWLRSRGEPYDGARTRSVLAERRDNVFSFVPVITGTVKPEEVFPERMEKVAHPFVGYDMVGGLQWLDRELQQLSKGVHAEDYEILIVGGSVAQMFGHYGIEELERVLGADERFRGRGFHFLTFGRGGFKQPQQLAMVSYLLALGFEPEAVLNLDGFNEVALGTANLNGYNTSSVYPSYPHWAALVQGAPNDANAAAIQMRVQRDRERTVALCDLALRAGFAHSSLLGSASMGAVEHLRERIKQAQQQYEDHVRLRDQLVTHGPWINPALPEPLLPSVRAWTECSLMLDAICKARGMLYLHVLQPTLHDPGAKPITEEEAELGAITDNWKKGVLTGYPLLRAAGRYLAERGVAFVDGSKFFADVEETLYIDNCHVGEEGNRMLAGHIGAAFLEALGTTALAR